MRPQGWPVPVLTKLCLLSLGCLCTVTHSAQQDGPHSFRQTTTLLSLDLPHYVSRLTFLGIKPCLCLGFPGKGIFLGCMVSYCSIHSQRGKKNPENQISYSLPSPISPKHKTPLLFICHPRQLCSEVALLVLASGKLTGMCTEGLQPVSISLHHWTGPFVM